jgi:hypothetical protein
MRNACMGIRGRRPSVDVLAAAAVRPCVDRRDGASIYNASSPTVLDLVLVL